MAYVNYGDLFARLPNMSSAELHATLKETILAPSGGVDTVAATLFLNELHHRDADAQTKQMTRLTEEVRDLTRTMLRLTVAIAGLTVLNLIFVACK